MKPHTTLSLSLIHQQLHSDTLVANLLPSNLSLFLSHSKLTHSCCHHSKLEETTYCHFSRVVVFLSWVLFDCVVAITLEPLEAIVCRMRTLRLKTEENREACKHVSTLNVPCLHDIGWLCTFLHNHILLLYRDDSCVSSQNKWSTPSVPSQSIGNIYICTSTK